MSAAEFELHVVLPRDARFAETMRELAAHAARYAGCSDADASAYGEAVAAVVHRCLDRSAAGADVPITLRGGSGPVEFMIACEGRVDAATRHGRISIGWTDDEGGRMCRVAVEPTP